jgi:hypothetical protein
VLPHEEAEKLNKRVTEYKRKVRLAGGAAVSSAPDKPKRKKAKIVKDHAVDPDMAVSSGDGIGRASL